MRSNNDPTAPGTDTVPPSAREEDVSPVRRRTITRRRKEKCPYCDSTLTGFSNLVSHCRSFHPEHPPPLPELKCDFCDMVFPTRRSTAQHRSRCAHNPDATRHLNRSARRRSLLPQDQPASTSTPIGPQETLHHLLLECPGTLAVRQRLALNRTSAPKSSLNGSCFIAGNFCRCSTTSSALRWHCIARRAGKSRKKKIRFAVCSVSCWCWHCCAAARACLPRGMRRSRRCFRWM
ncbi:L1Tc protein [Trypanosoma cruzi]|nr:L1Tc protein [Trypanosoma cruzi]